MALDNIVGLLLAFLVLYLMYKAMGGPKWKKPTHRRKSRKRTVRVDPLLAKEAKLATELRHVRAQIKDRDTAIRHL